MAVYFFDSSALVKRYAAETGSTWVGQVTDPKSANRIYIATITGVEVISALMKKVRDTQCPLPLSDAQKAIAEFRNDFGNQYELFSITDEVTRKS
jgi:predicted nucleic acid-binding protein